MQNFKGYDFALVVTFGSTKFQIGFPYTKNMTVAKTIKTLLEEWLSVYAPLKEIDPDDNIRDRSNTRWYKRRLRFLNVHVSTGIL